MTDKPTIKIGYLRITDHLILGIAQSNANNGKIVLDSFNLETVPFMDWNQVSAAKWSGENERFKGEK